jgi:hypothetical protein
VTSGENDEEAAWLDLIEHYDAPAGADAGHKPWPERENLAENNATIPGTSRATRAPEAPPGGGGTRPAPMDSPFGADLNAPTEPDLTTPGQPGWPGRPSGSEHGKAEPNRATPGPRSAGRPEMQEEHYFPPPPPPLPKLDPLTKGAWAALFGGPAYLLIATAVGWTVPAVAAFFAIGAFVGGFAVLVMRMGDEPRDGDGPDDGAVG